MFTFIACSLIAVAGLVIHAICEYRTDCYSDE